MGRGLDRLSAAEDFTGGLVQVNEAGEIEVDRDLMIEKATYSLERYRP